MVGELTSGALTAQPSQALQGASAPDWFRWADAFTLKHEGGATTNDGIGHTANQGIDQNAHPGMNVLALSPQQTQQIRRQYWTAVNGDALAQHDPRLALVAYETAIASGPATAQRFLAESGGDVNKMMALRVNFMNGLVQRDPEKYGPVAQGWANRNRDLAQAAGLDPTHFGLPAGGARQSSAMASQGPSLVDQMSERMGPLTGQAPQAQNAQRQSPQPETPAAPPASPQGSTPTAAPLQATPVQPVSLPAKQDLYLDLLKHRQGANG